MPILLLAQYDVFGQRRQISSNRFFDFVPKEFWLNEKKQDWPIF
tara:strand:+ start:39051 stop:39182 length:132 start_codon:yes stop_codon:yes gene_type:complete